MIHTRGATLKQLAVAAVMSVFFGGCAAVLPPDQGVVDSAPLDQDEGVVFGILAPNSYNSKGEKLAGKATPEIGYSLFYGVAENIAVKRAFSGLNESIDGNTKYSETFFAMRLPAGEYSMFQLHRPFSGTTGIIITDVRFTVTPNKATYIGSLQIDFRSTRGLFGQDRVAEKVAFRVTEDVEKATKMYRERNPSLGYEIATDLMKIRK